MIAAPHLTLFALLGVTACGGGLSDGRKWTVPIPDDEFASPVTSLAYVDEQVLYFATETQIHRVHVDALGEGTPGE